MELTLSGLYHGTHLTVCLSGCTWRPSWATPTTCLRSRSRSPSWTLLSRQRVWRTNCWHSSSRTRSLSSRRSVLRSCCRPRPTRSECVTLMLQSAANRKWESRSCCRPRPKKCHAHTSKSRPEGPPIMALTKAKSRYPPRRWGLSQDCSDFLVTHESGCVLPGYIYIYILLEAADELSHSWKGWMNCPTPGRDGWIIPLLEAVDELPHSWKDRWIVPLLEGVDELYPSCKGWMNYPNHGSGGWIFPTPGSSGWIVPLLEGMDELWLNCPTPGRDGGIVSLLEEVDQLSLSWKLRINCPTGRDGAIVPLK